MKQQFCETLPLVGSAGQWQYATWQAGSKRRPSTDAAVERRYGHITHVEYNAYSNFLQRVVDVAQLRDILYYALPERPVTYLQAL